MSETCYWKNLLIVRYWSYYKNLNLILKSKQQTKTYKSIIVICICYIFMYQYLFTFMLKTSWTNKLRATYKYFMSIFLPLSNVRHCQRWQTSKSQTRLTRYKLSKLFISSIVFAKGISNIGRSCKNVTDSLINLLLNIVLSIKALTIYSSDFRGMWYNGDDKIQ